MDQNRRFYKQWLAAPQEVKDLLVVDEFTRWVCPECGWTGSRPPDHVLLEVPFCWTCMVKTRKYTNLQPVPDLTQLLGMVYSTLWTLNCEILILDIPGEQRLPFRFALFDVDKVGWENFEADSPEEAVLMGILWERGVKT